MFVCLCNGYRDSELREAARSVVGGVEEVYASLGGEPACRGCLDYAEDIIEQVRSAETTAEPTPMELALAEV